MTFARWWLDTPYFSPISATASWRSGHAASSNSAKMAMRLEICSFIVPRCVCSIELLLELEIWTGRHSLAAEEHEVEPVAPRNHGPHLVHAGRFEFRREGLEQGPSHAVQTRMGLDRKREHPAARRRAEFPCSHLTDDETKDRTAGRGRFVGRARLGDQKGRLVPAILAIAGVHLAPIVGLGQAGDPLVERDDVGDIGRTHWTNCERARLDWCGRFHARRLRERP